MRPTKTVVLGFAACLAAVAGGGNALGLFAGSPAEPRAQQAQAPKAAVKQIVGVIKTISGSAITLAPDAGANVSVRVQESARIVRVEPGQTDLKTAATIQLSDLQAGDRVLVRGTASDNGQSFEAFGIIAMKRSDLDAKRAHEREDWQKRGIGGLVSASDAGAGTITISVAALGAPKAVVIHTTKDTVIRRYAPDSVQFDDATASSLGQIKAGDQLRARGTRGADSNEFEAEEIVSGAFRNVAGTISSVDAGANTLTVMDLITKKPVVVKLTAQSQILKLPPQVAQGIAARLKGGAAGISPGNAGGGGAADSGRPAGGDQRAGGNARAGGAQADLQQIVSRMPPASLADLQKGDAVMMVSTEGTGSGGVTAITLVGGVEPILTASPSGAQAINLSPWTLGGPADAGEASP